MPLCHLPALLASYFAARADVALARERGEALGARRWLVYPPMVVVSLVLFLALWIASVCILQVAASGRVEEKRKKFEDAMKLMKNRMKAVIAEGKW